MFFISIFTYTSICFVFVANIDPSRRYLYLYIKAGRAFLEHIDENNGTPGQVASYFTFHILFRGQRFRSRPVACACEPDIDEGFLLELHKDGTGMFCVLQQTFGLFIIFTSFTHAKLSFYF